MIYNKCNDIQIAFSMSAFLNHPHIYQWTMSNDDFDNHDDHASDADADYSLWLNVSFFHMYSTNMLILISRIMMLIMMMRMTILCVWIFHSSLCRSHIKEHQILFKCWLVRNCSADYGCYDDEYDEDEYGEKYDDDDADTIAYSDVGRWSENQWRQR